MPKQPSFSDALLAYPIGEAAPSRSMLARLLSEGAPQMGPPTIEFPMGVNGETQTRSAGVGPVGPAPSPMAQYLQGIGQDIANDPMGAAKGALDFATLGAGHGADLVEGVGAALRGPLRQATEVESSALKARHRGEAIDVSRTPHWENQEHVPKGQPGAGQFKKLDPELKAEREKGIAARAENQKASEAAAKRSVEDAETVKRQQEYMQKHWGGQKLREEPSQEMLGTWKRPPKKPFRPY